MIALIVRDKHVVRWRRTLALKTALSEKHVPFKLRYQVCAVRCPWPPLMCVFTSG